MYGCLTDPAPFPQPQWLAGRNLALPLFSIYRLALFLCVCEGTETCLSFCSSLPSLSLPGSSAKREQGHLRLTIQKLTWHWGDSGHSYSSGKQGVLWKVKLEKPCFVQFYMFWFNLNVFSSYFSLPFYITLSTPLPRNHIQTMLSTFCPLFGMLSRNHISCLASWAQSGIRKKYFWLSTTLSVFLLQTVSGEFASVSFEISLTPWKSKVTWKEKEKPEMLHFSRYFYSDLDWYLPRLFY